MPVDASIYSQIRPAFQIDDPLTRAAKAQQVQMGAMQIKDAQRKFDLEDDLSSALSESGGDLSKASNLLAQRGRGQAAVQLQDKAIAQRKAQIDEGLKVAEAMGSDAIALDAAYRQALTNSGGNQQAAITAVSPVYQQVRARWKQMGHELPENFDPVSNFAGIGQAKELVAHLKSIAPSVHMTDTGGSVTPTNTNPLAGPVGPLAGTQPLPKTAPPAVPTELARLTAERDALPEGDPRRATYDRVLENYKAGRGTDVTINQPGPMDLTKPAQGKVDEQLLETTKGLMAIETIRSQFKPEYQRFGDKVGYEALKVKDSTVGLTNKEKADLTGYTQYRRNAVENINQYINRMTGSAMGVQEAQRLMKAVPNPGSGLFDGDSPTEFEAKMNDVTKQLKMSVARLAYIKRNQMSLMDGQGNPLVPLERMPALINERGKAIEADLKKSQPDADQKAIERAVRRQLGVEFGLSSD